MKILDQVVLGNKNAFDGLLMGGKAHLSMSIFEFAGQEVEWGIAEKNGEHIIIMGENEGVNWKQVEDCGGKAVAHSHPYLQSRELDEHGMEFSTIWNNPNRIWVLPSNSDIVFSAESQYKSHRVITPYIAFKENEKWRINNQLINGNLKNLHFEIIDAKIIDCELFSEYFFPICVYKLKAMTSNGTKIWEGIVKTSSIKPQEVPKLADENDKKKYNEALTANLGNPNDFPEINNQNNDHDFDFNKVENEEEYDLEN